MGFSEIAKTGKELAKGIESGQKFLENIGNLGSNVQGQLNNLQDQAWKAISGAVENVQLEIEGKLLSSRLLADLDNFLGGEGNEIVGAFSSILSALSGKGTENSPQTLSGMLVHTLAGDKLIEKLQDPTSGPVLERMERANPGYLFRLCMESPNIKNLANISVGTTIRVLYQEGKSRELINYIDQNLTLSLVLPDPAIEKIEVTKRGTDTKEEYTRFFHDHKYVFRKSKEPGKPNSQGEILQLKDIAEFTIKGKDETTDRKKLWEQKAEDSHTNLSERLSNFEPLSNYTEYQKDKVAKVMDAYGKLSYAQKLSPGGYLDAGCFMTARNLTYKAWNGFDLQTTTQEPVARNTERSPEMLADRQIPKLIKEKQLPPGTVFHIRRQPGANDPRSLDKTGQVKNHWFTFVGYIKKGSEEIPYFVDQFGYGNIKRMNGGYDDMRYFHQAFVPPAAAKDAPKSKEA